MPVFRPSPLYRFLPNVRGIPFDIQEGGKAFLKTVLTKKRKK
jgi:hypothetical protein